MATLEEKEFNLELQFLFEWNLSLLRVVASWNFRMQLQLTAQTSSGPSSSQVSSIFVARRGIEELVTDIGHKPGAR